MAQILFESAICQECEKELPPPLGEQDSWLISNTKKEDYL